MREPFKKTEIKVAVLGGGTGSFMMLSALKKYTSQIAAIVNMVDDGGSTGVLRDELGVLPSGDVRQCLVALSDTKKIRDLFSYRFDEGTFGGHSFGNILITALEKVTGSFSEAVETASEILNINGAVLPGTLDDVRLKMEWAEHSHILNGERVIDKDNFKFNPKEARISLIPEPKVNPRVIDAIFQADVVVIAPGDLYTSIGPLLVIPGVGEALRKTKAVCIYAANLVTKNGQTDGFSVEDHAEEIERFAGVKFLDYVLYNTEKPSEYQQKRYQEEKSFLVKLDGRDTDYTLIEGNFLGQVADKNKADTLPVTRSLIRHDIDNIASKIIEVYNNHILNK